MFKKKKENNKETETIEEEKNKNENNELGSLKEENSRLKEENAQINDKLLRLASDYQNMKKRLLKEVEEKIDSANESFAIDMLEVLDTLYIAQDMIEDEKSKEGIKNTIDKFTNILKKYHIEEVLYDVFDPEYHQSIQKTNHEDIEDGKITGVFKRGFRRKDKLIREAMVSVNVLE